MSHSLGSEISGLVGWGPTSKGVLLNVTSGDMAMISDWDWLGSEELRIVVFNHFETFTTCPGSDHLSANS